MKEQLKAYIKDLNDERTDLLVRLTEIEAELKEFEELISITKEPEERKKVCPLCKGKGEYWDFWGGNLSCPECGGTGWK